MDVDQAARVGETLMVPILIELLELSAAGIALLATAQVFKNATATKASFALVNRYQNDLSFKDLKPFLGTCLGGKSGGKS
ncbi:MAG: hypothetical protein ACI9PY_003298 [Ascidiaceihabitans sp.]